MTRTKPTVRRLPQVVVNPPGCTDNKKNFKQKTKKYTLQNKKVITSIKSCRGKQKLSSSEENECQKKKHLFLK